MTPQEMNALKEQLDALMADVQIFQNAMAPLQEERKEIALTWERLQKQDITLQNKLTDYRRQMNNAQSEAERLNQQLEQALAIEKMNAEFLALEDRWNTLTKDAPWREHAMKHQHEVSDKMVFTRKHILADVMGLGKTLSALMTIDKIKAATTDGDVWWEKPNSWSDYMIEHHDAPVKKVLYLSPAELVRNVQPEVKKWTNTRSIVLSKQNKLQRQMSMDLIEELVDDGIDVFVQINYEIWRKDFLFHERLVKLGFDVVVLDEAHVLKNRESVNYRGVSALLKGMTLRGEKVADPVRFVFPMTGTPFKNRPHELFSILTLVKPNLFRDSKSSENDFLNNYCMRVDTNKWVFRPGGIESLAKQIADVYTRRTLKDAGIVLPEQTITYHELDIDEENYPRQAEARNEMRLKSKLMLDTDKGISSVAFIVLTQILRLRQIETWPDGIKEKDAAGRIIAQADVKQSQKLDYIINREGEGLLTEVCPDHRTAMFSQFNDALEVAMIRAEAAGLRCVMLTGNTPDAIKAEVKMDFDRSRCYENGRSPKWDVVFANYKAGGQGLNFTDVTQLIALDEEWSDANAQQAFARMNRIGQIETNAVHIVRMNGTIDTWLAALIEEKKNLTSNFNQAVDKQALRDAIEKGDV